jgi:hypothetical protein
MSSHKYAINVQALLALCRTIEATETYSYSVIKLTLECRVKNIIFKTFKIVSRAQHQARMIFNNLFKIILCNAWSGHIEDVVRWTSDDADVDVEKNWRGDVWNDCYDNDHGRDTTILDTNEEPGSRTNKKINILEDKLIEDSLIYYYVSACL